MIVSLAVALGLGRLLHVGTGEILGMFAGSMTSTPTLQAALDLIGDKTPSIGYSVSYPFGVIGPILCFYFMTRAVKPNFPPPPARFHMAEITIERLPGKDCDAGRCDDAAAGRRAGLERAAGAPQPLPERIDRAAAGRRPAGRRGHSRPRSTKPSPCWAGSIRTGWARTAAISPTSASSSPSRA